MKKWTPVLLALLLVAGCYPAAARAHVVENDFPGALSVEVADPEPTATPVEPGFDNFIRVNSYGEGPFTDVTEKSWFRDAVATAYELGLMLGTGEDFFEAKGTLTVAQAVTVAARVHRIYLTGEDSFPSSSPWYAAYVDYAREHGIYSQAEGEKLTETVTRARFADILSRALPADALPEINMVPDDKLPDVKTEDDYAGSIYLLYRAGILTGNDKRGTFLPGNSITRAEVAAILTRMADPGQRKSVDFSYTGPDLIAGETLTDEDLSTAAVLGNSLAEGLRLYSGLKTVTYYSATSVSVSSAMNSKTETLSGGARGTLVQALCEHSYDRVYIELGINEISMAPATFAASYGKLVDAIREAEPEAEIYIVSVLPVTKAKSDSGAYNMPHVNGFNEVLRTLAEEKKCYYLDVCSVLMDEEGFLPASWSFDGVHLNPEQYLLWEDYLRTHHA